MPRICTACRHPRRDEIDRLLIDGESVPGIARQFDLTCSALYRHKSEHVMRVLERAVERRKVEVQDRLFDFAITRHENRLQAQQERWVAMLELRRARAEANADLPGGETGLVVRRRRKVGDEVVDEAVFDHAYAREIRELEKHTSQESGQWHDPRSSATGGTGTVIIVQPQLPEHLKRRELPVAAIVQHPDGRPTGWQEPDEEPMEIEAEPVECEPVSGTFDISELE